MNTAAASVKMCWLLDKGRDETKEIMRAKVWTQVDWDSVNKSVDREV